MDDGQRCDKCHRNSEVFAGATSLSIPPQFYQEEEHGER